MFSRFNFSGCAAVVLFSSSLDAEGSLQLHILSVNNYIKCLHTRAISQYSASGMGAVPVVLHTPGCCYDLITLSDELHRSV